MYAGVPTMTPDRVAAWSLSTRLARPKSVTRGTTTVRRGLRLGLEAAHVGRGRQLALENHLQRHGAVEADLPCLVHDAHAAAGDLLEQLVVAEVTERAEQARAG